MSGLDGIVTSRRAEPAAEVALAEAADVVVDEGSGKLTKLEGSTVGDIVNALNSMGVSPRDLIVILGAIKAAGAIDADIVSQ